MGHYKSNVRDLEFNLFEVLHLEKALATGEFGDLDGESVRQMLAEASKLAEGPIAESFAASDRTPPTFDPQTHTVSLPDEFKRSLNAWRHCEWFRIGLDDLKTMPSRTHSSANSACSATKPHPTQTASARASRRARSSASWST